jgi:uncharacterized membrane protein YoaK (UPF0700 family)
MNSKSPVNYSHISAFFMAAIGGFSDVFGFIALDRLFTAHVTGNIVVIIAFIIYDIKGITSKVLAIPLFMFFAAIVSAIIEHYGHRQKMLAIWLLVELGLFSLLLLCGLMILPHLKVTSVYYILISMLPVSAMAIHNTLLRTYMSTLPPCTVMTGNLTQFVIDLTAFCLSKYHGKLTPPEQSIIGVKRFGIVLLGFILGGLLSTFGFLLMGFSGLIFIIPLLLIMLIYVLSAKNG